MNESINKKYRVFSTEMEKNVRFCTCNYITFGRRYLFQMYFLEIVSALILGVGYKVAIPGSGVNERKVNIRRD